MLTPNEVHFLVGLLTVVSRPDGVEIELGSMIYDEAAEEERDVDITVRSTDADGVVSVFEGIEVKRHKRPLDVSHVEQLCVKLNDMPGITHRAIVSASGYYEPAVLKAKHNKVDLFLLKDWPGPLEVPGITLPEQFKIHERKYRWVGRTHVRFNPHMHFHEGIVGRILPDTPVTDERGAPVVSTPSVQSLSDLLARGAPALANERGDVVAVGQVRRVAVNIDLTPGAFVELDGTRIPLEKACVSGDLTQVENVIVPQFKALVKVGDDRPYAGCAISEMSDGNLAGVTVDRHSRSLRWINIPVNDRLLRKIYRRRLR